MDWLAGNSGIIVTVLFAVVFTGIAIWVFLPSNRKKLQNQAMIPFKEHKDE